MQRKLPSQSGMCEMSGALNAHVSNQSYDFRIRRGCRRAFYSSTIDDRGRSRYDDCCWCQPGSLLDSACCLRLPPPRKVTDNHDQHRPPRQASQTMQNTTSCNVMRHKADQAQVSNQHCCLLLLLLLLPLCTYSSPKSHLAPDSCRSQGQGN